jgi:hypothetical protein
MSRFLQARGNPPASEARICRPESMLPYVFWKLDQRPTKTLALLLWSRGRGEVRRAAAICGWNNSSGIRVRLALPNGRCANRELT